MIKIDFIDRSALGKGSNLRKDQEDRLRQIEAAERFLITGRNLEWDIDPPYGKEWNRDYNPNPYPEALPGIEMYEGTGIGFLYGIDAAVPDGEDLGEPTLSTWYNRVIYASELAGWNLVRVGAEVHKTSTKVDKKELLPPEER